MPAPNIASFETELGAAVERARKELAALRTDRATPSMVENILVDYFGTRVPIKQIAAISVPEPKTLALAPWDKQSLPALCKALETADLGVMPAVQGEVVRLTLPPLTEERRKVLQKEVARRCEDIRIAIRRLRDEAMDKAKSAEKQKEISEDALFRLKEDIENKVAKTNTEIERIRDAKINELSGQAR